MPLTNAEAATAVRTLLGPVTRNLYAHSGDGVAKTVVNAKGVDLHDGLLAALATTRGVVDPYVLLTMHPRGDRHTRMSGGASAGQHTWSLLIGAGSPAGVLWALDRVQPRFARARLSKDGGLVEPYFDTVDVLAEPDVSPPRWYSVLRYRATTH